MQKIQNLINSPRNKSIVFAKQKLQNLSVHCWKKTAKKPIIFTNRLQETLPLKICLQYKQKKPMKFPKLVTARKLRILSLYYQKKLQNSSISSEKRTHDFLCKEKAAKICLMVKEKYYKILKSGKKRKAKFDGKIRNFIIQM